MESWQRHGAEFVDWLPAWAGDGLALGLAVTGALVLHALILRALRRLAAWRSPYLQTLLERISAVTRLAAMLLALAGALHVVTVAPLTARVLSQALLVAFIGLVGWAACLAVTLAADRYLARFSLDTGDLLARKHVTQIRIIKRLVLGLIAVVTVAAALMTFDAVRSYGVSLFASAGAAGIVMGLAARPVLSNLIAGVQIALTQPIRLEDTVVVENEFGWIEEITSTYVVVRLWDWRRLIVPLSHFIEKPFQNWTRDSTSVIGAVFLYVDYKAPIDRIRSRAETLVRASPLWDKQVFNLQVWEVTEQTLQLRILVSTNNAGANADLRAEIREKVVAFLRDELPEALPRRRPETTGVDDDRAPERLSRPRARA